MRCLPLLLLVVAVGNCAGDGVPVLEEAVIKLDDGTVLQMELFNGRSLWAALQHTFTSSDVVVDCPGFKSYAVYTGRSVEEVRQAYGRKDHAWCGWEHALGQSPACATPLRTLGPTYVAVAKPRGWLASGSGGGECTMERREWLSMARLLAAVLGAFLFWNAGPLSASTPFRLTGGTLGCILLSALLVLFIMYRQVPHKRSLFMGSALFGTSFLATVRYAFGTFLPSLQQVAQHPLFLGYVALSGLTGLAATYWYNNPADRKVTTMLRGALQMVGLASVALSAALPQASAAGVAGLVGAKLASRLRGHGGVRAALRSAQRDLRRDLGVGPAGCVPGGAPAPGAVPWEERAGGREAREVVAERLLSPPGQGHPHVEAARIPTWLAEASPVVSMPATPKEPEISPLVQRGLLLNEETGHLIQIGKSTYTRLVESGYVVNRSKGIITPPPASPGTSPAKLGRGSGRRHKRREVDMLKT